MATKAIDAGNIWISNRAEQSSSAARKRSREKANAADAASSTVDVDVTMLMISELKNHSRTDSCRAAPGTGRRVSDSGHSR